MKKFSNTVCVDTNILVYAIDEENPFYERARGFLDKVRFGKIGAVVAVQNITEFYATVTSSRRGIKGLGTDRAWKEVEKFLGFIDVIYPTSGVIVELKYITEDRKILGQDVYDAFLAATILSNGVKTLITENKDDFAGIAGLKAVSLEDWKRVSS